MKVGRPPVPDEMKVRVRELRKMGLGYKRIANETGLGRTTVRRILWEMRVEKGGQNSRKPSGGP